MHRHAYKYSDHMWMGRCAMDACSKQDPLTCLVC